jgi:ABC-type lipoprotein export system ATPase subunit
MLSFHQVTREFRLSEEITISPVCDVTLDVKPGEFIVITGRSGTGKSTLLNLACGLIKPTSGKVTVAGHDLGNLNDARISAMRCRQTGFIFQFPSLLPSLSVKDNVCLPAIFVNGQTKAGVLKRATELLDMLGLSSKLNVYPKQLSAGEQKRVAIVRSLVNQPALILADEPTSDLDERTEAEVMDLFRQINETGATFVIVTHNLGLRSFATRAFEMDNGQLNQVNGMHSAL